MPTRPANVAPKAAPRGAHAHAATLSSGEVTSRQLTLLVVQGTLIGCAILAVLGAVLFFFGDTLRSHFYPLGGVAQGSAPTGPAPTVYYRDRGDGTVTVMEIDGNGARLKGTMHRNDVPLLQADKVREGWGSGAGNLSPSSRVNALGSSFR